MSAKGRHGRGVSCSRKIRLDMFAACAAAGAMHPRLAHAATRCHRSASPWTDEQPSACWSPKMGTPL
eukprot:3678102-Alexandrium_andersonii.AAC.1